MTRWLPWSSNAREAGKPVVIEKLDFRQKKAALEGESRKYSRMLSSFSYGKIKAWLHLSRLSARSRGTPSQPCLQFGDWCPASTRLAESCCLTEECYRNFSAGDQGDQGVPVGSPEFDSRFHTRYMT